jgi:aldehyde dehydrogenase (NAD+)
MADSHGIYIDGEWRESKTGDTFDVRNPADTSEVIATYQQSSPDRREERSSTKLRNCSTTEKTN